MMRVDLSGRTAVVTGGTRGICLAITRALLDAGASVVALSRAEDQVAAMRARYANEPCLRVEVADVRDRAALERIRDSLDALHVLVPNAGVASRVEALDLAFHSAPYGIYRTADGAVAISMAGMAAVRRALGNPEELAPFEDPSVAFTRRDEIANALAGVVARMATAEVVDRLRADNLWCAPVNDLDAAYADAALRHLEPVLEFEHPRAGPVRVLKHPVRYSAGEPELRQVPPRWGSTPTRCSRSLATAQPRSTPSAAKADSSPHRLPQDAHAARSAPRRGWHTLCGTGRRDLVVAKQNPTLSPA